MQYDLFVCHASEDKEAFVRPLCDALIKLHHRVWYDEFSLKLGDSLRRSIDKGLNTSRYGLVVLSNSFFGKNWSNYELDSLVSRENDSGEKVILPIWHGVSKREVLQYSAALADRIAVESSKGTAHVVEKIAEVLLKSSNSLVASDVSAPLRSVDELILSLFASYPGDRAKAARALGQLGPTAAAALDALRGRLRDSSGQVRDAAQWAILKINPQKLSPQQKNRTLEDKLDELKRKFEASDLDGYFDILLEG